MSTEDIGCTSCWTTLFRCVRLMHILTAPFGFGTTTIPEHQEVGSMIGVIMPCSNILSISCFTFVEEDVLLFWVRTDKREWRCLWAWLNIPSGDFPIHGKVWEILAWSWVCWCYQYMLSVPVLCRQNGWEGHCAGVPAQISSPQSLYPCGKVWWRHSGRSEEGYLVLEGISLQVWVSLISPCFLRPPWLRLPYPIMKFEASWFSI